MSTTSGLKLTVWNPYPSANGAISHPAGGSWLAGTYSFLLVAFMEATEDWDNAGWALSVPALWQNITISLNDKITLSWTWPTGLATPDHYVLLWQSGATFTLGSAATRALLVGGGSSNISGALLTATLEAPGSVSATAPASYSSFSLNPVREPGLGLAVRPMKARDIGGLAFKQSFSHTAVAMPDAQSSVVPPFESMTIPLLRLSTSDANRRKLIHWSTMENHLVLEDEASGDDHEYKYYYGSLTAVPYPGTNQKGEAGQLEVVLLVEGVVRA